MTPCFFRCPITVLSSCNYGFSEETVIDQWISEGHGWWLSVIDRLPWDVDAMVTIK
jgi:hypothetical protein